MPDVEDDPDFRKVRAVVHQLHEHFDTVQIIVTRDRADASRMVQWGAGNLFARAGSARAWLSHTEEYLAAQDEPEDDDA